MLESGEVESMKEIKLFELVFGMVLAWQVQWWKWMDSSRNIQDSRGYNSYVDFAVVLPS